jgi:predicted house-cleaning noncanonical NTP pyrophosphatase (MazG superfamily)
MNDLIPKSLCMVYKDSIKILKDDEINKEKVGAKAYGLSIIPSIWTLPFFVISSEMYEMYISSQNIEELENLWKTNIFQAMHDMRFDFSQNLFLRSNMPTEDIVERGQYESYECSINMLFIKIKVLFDNIKDMPSNKTIVPLLVQQYSQVIGNGHISNERRLSKEHRDWKGEIEQQINWNGKLVIVNNGFTIPLRNWRRKIILNEVDIKPLACSSLDNIDQVLVIPCTWATNSSIRIHFEWVFDGKYLYIVQADQEQDYGIKPIVLVNSSYHSQKNIFSPKVLHILSSEDEEKYLHYSKIRNSLIYKKLGLKTAPIYILEDKHELQELLNGKATEQFSSDLNALTINPLVIRIDVDTEDQNIKQMLPRTDDIRNMNDAIIWLINNVKELHDKYNGKLSFIFILHNFIPAFSSAFAYADPNNRNVLIESLWGVPDGLYYYSHDKHILDTKQQNFAKVTMSNISIIQKKINAKNNFIFPDATGKWNNTLVSTEYIWRPAIPNELWLKEMAMNTRKIAEHIGTGVSVMWFVGVNSKTYGCNVFPWHHEKYTYNDVPKQANRKRHLNELEFKINQSVDLEKLQNIVQSGNKKNIRYLSFKPIEKNMIRNKDIIKEVGRIAKALNAVILFEGGILSHAYYQLKNTGAAIEVSDTFDNTVLDIEYDKLVRDKIPEKIKNGGELITIKKLSSDELFEQLRIKLVEEAFEVLEAENANDLIQELADVLEVIESIISKKKIQEKSVTIAKTRKREKIGGFDDGILLRKTALPVYKSIIEIDKKSSKKEDQATSWGDKKEKVDYNEMIKRLKIPVSLKNWGTQLTVKGVNERPDIHVVLKGKRVNANFQIEISINEDLRQLTLFDE